MPATVPTELARAMGWPENWAAATALEKLVAARLFGRSRDRTAICAAWDEAARAGMTMQDLIDLLPDSPLRVWAGKKLGYVNRHRA
jgi:hypothetical protein